MMSGTAKNAPKPDVLIHLENQRWKALLRPYCKTVEASVQAALEVSGLKPGKCILEIAVVLTDDKKVRALNRDYRGKDKATNVLSFPSEEHILSQFKSLSKGQGSFHLGDIALAAETIEREAKEQGKKPREHAMHLIVHGVLHLLGFDHMEEKQADSMEALEIKALKKLTVSNPYL